MAGRTRTALLAMVAAAAVAGCSSEDSAPAVANAGAGEATQSAPAPAVAAETPARAPAACAASLRAEIHAESFDGGGAGPRPDAARLEALEALEALAGALFRDVARDLCAEGEIDPARFAPFDRLLVQNGAGADDSVVYIDGETFGPATLVFQYAFASGDEAGTLAAPDPRDVREALVCHFAPQANEAMCGERMP